MSGKFMKVMKVVIPTLVVLVIASQLVGAVACSQSEMLEMINNQQAIEIEIAEPINQEQGTERELEWLELAFLQTYPEFRDIFDDAIGVTAHGQNGKNGIIYVDLTGKHTNNSTLYYAFMNNKFLTKCWNNTDTMKKLTDAVKNVYADVDSDAVAKIALLNAYFNIFPDAEPNYFNGSSTLTRGEFLAGVYRASNPVSDIEINGALASIVDPANQDETVIFSSQMLDYSYLNLEDKSLHHNTYNTTISRAEAIYTIVQMFYADEYNATTGKESCYSDAKNGGDIASKQLFIEKDKKTGVVNYKDYWKSYELSYSIQNPTKGLPDDLYKALVVAKNHNLISGSESRWDEGLTKGECLKLLVKVYESKGTITNADRGASTGEVINNSQNTITSKDLYFDDNEKLVYTDKLVEYVKSFDSMKDLTDEQIKKVIESQKFKELTGLAVMYGNPVGAVDLALNSIVTDSLIRDALNGLPTAGVDTTAGNTGGGKDSELETSDNNKGGSEDNEVVADEDFVTPETDIDNNEIDDFEFVEQDTEPETTTTQDKEDNSKGYTCTYYGYVETMYARDNVNVRKGPSTDYEKVSSLYKGDEVKVIGVCNETGWYCIVKDRAAVFVSGKYLSKTKPIIKNPVTDTTEEPTTQGGTSQGGTTQNTPKEVTGTIYIEGQGEVTCKGTMINGYFVADGYTNDDVTYNPDFKIRLSSYDELFTWTAHCGGHGHIDDTGIYFVPGHNDGGEKIDSGIQFNY